MDLAIPKTKDLIERPGPIAEIKKKLQIPHANASIPHAVNITGPSGAGKTWLAMNYIQETLGQYSPVLIIKTWDEDFVRLMYDRTVDTLQLRVNWQPKGENLSLRFGDGWQEIDDQLERFETRKRPLGDYPPLKTVLQELAGRKEGDQKWLLFIDGADDISEEMKKAIPKGGCGSVVCASVHDVSPELDDLACETVHLDGMEPLEAREFFLQRLEILKPELKLIPEEYLLQWDDVALQLGYMPLAMDLAAAWIGNDPDPKQALEQYSEEHAKYICDLMEHSERYGDLSESDMTFWAAFNMTLAKIEERHPDLKPRWLLALLANFKGTVIQDEMFYLASLHQSHGQREVKDGEKSAESVKIPEDWLTRILFSDGKTWDHAYYQESLVILLRYNLLDRRTEGGFPGVTMHEQIRRCIMETDTLGFRAKYLQFTVVISAASQFVDEYDKPEGSPLYTKHLLAHIPELSREYLTDLGMGEEEMESVWYIFARAYHTTKRYDEAEELFLRRVETTKGRLGDEHPDTLYCLFNLAFCLWDKRCLKESEELYRQVLESRKKVLGLAHKDTIVCINNLLAILQKEGKWEDAGQLCAEMVEAKKELLGLEHPETLGSMSLLGYLLSKLGRTKEVIELESGVLEARKKVLGPEHPDTLNSMTTIVSALVKEGELEKAREMSTQAVESAKRIFGETDPKTLSAMNGLAQVLSNQNQWQKAEELSLHVFETRKSALGEAHEDTLRSMRNLALTWYEQDRLEEALALIERCSELQMKFHNFLFPGNGTAETLMMQNQWQAEAKSRRPKL